MRRRVDSVIITSFLLFVMADQAVKQYVRSHMDYGQSIPVITEFLHITYIENPGAAFGMLEYRTGLFLAVTCAMFVFMAYLYPRMERTVYSRLAMGMLAGGAVGNAWDRVQYGKVTDFLDFRIWPIFNIADIAIVLGVGILMFAILREQQSIKERGQE